MDSLHISNDLARGRHLRSPPPPAKVNAGAPGTTEALIEVSSSSAGKKRKSSALACLVKATASRTKALVLSIDKI